jgi:hypothetical protein
MKNFNKDIFQGEWDGMVHCANLYKTMGAGIARIVKAKYPEAYEADCETILGTPNKLGTFSHARIEIEKPIDIFNLYGQMGMGNDGHPMNRNARYDAVYDGIYRICEFIIASKPKSDYILAFPHKIASDRAGGDWIVIEAILESVESYFPNIQFHIYKHMKPIIHAKISAKKFGGVESDLIMKKIKSYYLLRLDLDGTLDEAIEMLNSYKERYSDYTNLRIVEDCVYEGGYFYDLHGDRLETDQEETNRINAEKIQSERQLEYERKQYEALKAKFENN